MPSYIHGMNSTNEVFPSCDECDEPVEKTGDSPGFMAVYS